MTDIEATDLFKELADAMSDKEKAELLAAARHWLRDPMGAVEIMFEGDLHGPYSTANTVLISAGLLEDVVLP